MAFALAVLLVGVLDGDVFVHEVLVVHVGDGVVGGFEVGVGDEAVAFGEVGFVAGDLKARQYVGERTVGGDVPLAVQPAYQSGRRCRRASARRP